MAQEKVSVKQFLMNVLNAVGIGVVVALAPNALLGELLKFLKEGNVVLETLFQMVVLVQFFMPFIIGVLAAYHFKFNGAVATTIGVSAQLGSGAVQFKDGAFQLVGIGDIINVILVLLIACLIYYLLQGKLGSFELITIPILIPIVSGGIGLITLPYVAKVTQGLGNIINTFTELNPLVMSILICIAFALLMVTPISLVAIAAAIGLTGLGSGAANLGIVAACVTFLFGSLRINSVGVNVMLFSGATKMMIPVYFKHLIIMVPLIINGIIGGLLPYFANIQGTPMSAGFGYVGLVGPINAYNRMGGDPTMNIIILLFVFLIIPFTCAFFVHQICKKLIKPYSDEIYKFELPES